MSSLDFRSDARFIMWTIVCPCKAMFQMEGEKILEAESINCPNCKRSPNLSKLKEAVETLRSFQNAIYEASCEEHQENIWGIYPEGLEKYLK